MAKAAAVLACKLSERDRPEPLTEAESRLLGSVPGQGRFDGFEPPPLPLKPCKPAKPAAGFPLFEVPHAS